MTQEERKFSFPNRVLGSEELRERVSNKALAKLFMLSEKIKTLEPQVDNPPFGLSSELVQVQIESNLKEVEVWKFILNNAS